MFFKSNFTQNYQEKQQKQISGLELYNEIFKAIQKNNLRLIHTLDLYSFNINFNAMHNNVDFDQFLSPLQLCSYIGDYEIAKYLLKHPKIDVDFASEPSGFTPLQLASLTGNFELVQILLDNGAEPNKPNCQGKTALSLVFNRFQSQEYNFENQRVTYRMAQMLIDYGADVNWIIDKKKGDSYLIQLVKKTKFDNEDQLKNNQGVIKFLNDNGALIEYKNFQEQSFLTLLQNRTDKDKIIQLCKLENIQ